MILTPHQGSDLSPVFLLKFFTILVVVQEFSHDPQFCDAVPGNCDPREIVQGNEPGMSVHSNHSPFRIRSVFYSDSRPGTIFNPERVDIWKVMIILQPDDL
jgi:hypothetical protein